MSIMPEPRRDVDDLVCLERTGRLEAALADDERRPPATISKHQQGEDGIADDHERIARPPRRTRRHRHLLGLESGAGAARGDAFAPLLSFCP